MKLSYFIKQKEELAKEKKLEIDAISYLIKNYFFDNVSDYYLALNEEFDKEDELNKITSLYLDSLKPVQYILGYTYFLGLKIKVNENVLIPRRETEEVTLKAIELINKMVSPNVLDLCTGSGAIAISIRKMTKAVVTASDISNLALEVAKENAIINNTSINFLESDLFNSINDKFDLIISNPPYLSEKDKKLMSPIVYKNEPNIALFASDNGLYYYKKILDEALNYLKNDKYLVLEIGDDEKDSIILYAKSKYPNIEYQAYNDMQNKNRILIFKF